MSATIDTSAELELPYVLGELHYLGPMTERPRNYTYEPPPGVARSNIVSEDHVVPIRSARPIADRLTLDKEGFELINRPTAVRDFWNEEEIRTVYYPEVEQALKDITGADKVFVFDHTLRRRVRGAEDRSRDAPRQPVPRVHVDHTEKSAPQRVRDFFGEEAAALLRGRVQVINLWRPITGPLRDAPLAVCDARTVASEDLVGSDLVYRDRVGETYAVRFNPAHRWYYVPEMKRDEVLLLKCYDSRRDVAARFMPHTAFEDPTAPANVLPRESIEIRTLVFHTA
jgi:hypothetical protein